MSYFIERRRWERPDRPQPVYTGALALWEAPRYVPIGDATRNSYRAADRVSDRTYVQQTAPAFTWVQPVVDAAVQRWMAGVTAEPSYRSGDRARLDVRAYEWSPEPAWIFSTLPVVTTTAQQWPAILQNSGLSYRSDERPRLDVRRYEWFPSFAWAPRVADAVVASWIPVFDAEVSYRPPARALLDVRGYEWSPQFGWIFNAQPVPATTAQQWPAVLQNSGLSYRSTARARLDVRNYEWSQFGWVATIPAPVVPDTTLGHRAGPIVIGTAHRTGPIVPSTGKRSW